MSSPEVTAHLCSFPPSYSLTERTFKTVDFYRKHQDVLTPASLAFFQSQWDESVTNTFHTLLSKYLAPLRPTWAQVTIKPTLKTPTMLP